MPISIPTGFSQENDKREFSLLMQTYSSGGSPENLGRENDGSRKDQWVENAGPENDGPVRRCGK